MGISSFVILSDSKKPIRENLTQQGNISVTKQSNSTLSSLHRHALCSLLITIVCLAIYSNSYSGQFVFDDHRNIVHNPSVHVTEISFRTLYDAAFRSLLNDRPLAYLSFALNYYVGRDNVVGYHVVNVLIHLTAAILVYVLTFRLLHHATRDDGQIAGPLGTGAATFAACVASLIFVAHPVQTQSVTYIVQRMSSMAAMFYLLSIWLYILGRGAEAHRRRILCWTGSAVAGILAIGSKPNAATLPLVLLLWEWYFYQDLSPRWLRRLLIIGGITAALIGVYGFVIYQGDPLAGIRAGYEFRDFGMGERLLTQGRVIVYYLSLLVYPLPSRMNLNPTISTSHSLWDPLTTLPAILVHVGLVAMAIWLARKQRLLSFCILWFYIHLAIESSIFPLEMIYQHRLYLPMFGAAVLIAWLFGMMFMHRRPSAVGLAALAVLFLSASSYERNQVYLDPLAMWIDVVAKSPNDYRAHYNRGVEYERIGDVEAALRDYSRSLEINPDYTLSRNCRGVLYTSMREFSRAHEDFAHIIRTASKNPAAYSNRGILYVEQGRFELAFEDFSKSLEIHPRFAPSYYNRGMAHGLLGELEQAIEDYSAAIACVRAYPDALLNRGAAYGKLRRFAEAEADFNQLLRIDPNSANAYLNRGVVRELQGSDSLAVSDFGEAIRLDEALGEAYLKRGRLLLQQGQPQTALQDLDQAVKYAEDRAAAHVQRATCLLNLRQLDLAQRDWTAAIALRPQDAQLYLLRGRTLVGLGRHADAIADFSQAIELEPNNGPAHAGRAVANFVLQRFDAARADVAQCQRLGQPLPASFLEQLEKASAGGG